uniref:Cytochrome b-c1 complex subunit 10 n=1 Tax=Kryptolebias marmoratus TaxID=37003 RepID=A0A3Q3F5G3_KRYMA
MSAKMIGKFISSKSVTIVKSPSWVGWSSAAGIALVYFTDWSLVLKYVPYINGKFKKEE